MALNVSAETFVSGAAAGGLESAATPTPSRPITSIADVRRGTMVTLQGTVERLLDTDEFRLRDASGAIKVYVGPNWVPAEVGEQVTVHGFVDHDLLIEVYARELTRADGTVVRFDTRGYE